MMTDQPESSDATRGGCDHVGPVELIEMSERWLAENRIASEQWEGSRFGWGENVQQQINRSVYLEVERRGGNWIVSRIDRSPAALAQEETGFFVRHVNR
jgi:hypothetical protein